MPLALGKYKSRVYNASGSLLGKLTSYFNNLKRKGQVLNLTNFKISAYSKPITYQKLLTGFLDEQALFKLKTIKLD
jgi:hypothetical protein